MSISDCGLSIADLKKKVFFMISIQNPEYFYLESYYRILVETLILSIQF
jgi:hypothetical protein